MKTNSNPNVIISISSGLVRPFLTYLTADKRIYFVYPEQTRGIAIGNTLMAAYLKAESINDIDISAMGSHPKVLICGQGATIHYLLETFVMQLESLLRRPGMDEAIISDSVRTRIFQDFLIVSDAPYFRSDTIAIAEEDIELKRDTGKLFKQKLYRLHIKKAMKPTDKFGPNTLDINAILCAPYEISNIDLIWDTKDGFDIVAITDDSAERVMLMLSSLITITNKYYKNRWPIILIGAESGQWHRLRNIADGNLFYNSFSKFIDPDFKPPEFYFYSPAQFGYFSKSRHMAFGDSLIDVLDDAKEQIAGILFSLRNELNGENQPPAVKLHLCIGNIPGSLATACAQLSNMLFKYYKSKDNEYKDIIIPSFSFCRFIGQNRENFCLSTYSSLKKTNADSFENAVIRAFVSTGRHYNTDDAYNTLESLMAKRLNLTDRNSNIKLEDCNKCPLMKSCAISGYIRHIIVRSERRKKADGHCYFSEKKLIFPLRGPLESPTFAKVTACCRQANEFGTLAFLLNTLCLRILSGEQITNQEDKNVDIFSITYGRDFDCFEDTRSLSRLYGNLISLKPQQFAKRVAQLSSQNSDAWKKNKLAEGQKNIIKGVLIRPCPQGFEYWENYANFLHELLKTNYGDYWKIYPPTETKRREFGVILIVEEELFNRKKREIKWRKRIDEKKQNKDGRKNEEEYDGPPKYHLCFCGEMKNGRPLGDHQPYEDCLFNKELNVLFEMNVFEVD